VPERRLLDIGRETKEDVVAVWRAGEAIRVAEDADTGVARGSIGGGEFQPLVYEAHFTDSAREGEVLAYLQDCATRFDVVEAFERMRAALQVLAKEDSRYA